PHFKWDATNPDWISRRKSAFGFGVPFLPKRVNRRARSAKRRSNGVFSLMSLLSQSIFAMKKPEAPAVTAISGIAMLAWSVDTPMAVAAPATALRTATMIQRFAERL